MNIRTAFDYMAPTTLAAVIHDALVCIDGDAAPMHEDAVNVKEIVTDAWDALVANTGTEDAMDELLNVGVGYDDLERVWS